MPTGWLGGGSKLKETLEKNLTKKFDIETCMEQYCPFRGRGIVSNLGSSAEGMRENRCTVSVTSQLLLLLSQIDLEHLRSLNHSLVLSVGIVHYRT